MILGVKFSKRKGCIIELEDPISGGVWKLKIGGAFSSRNIPLQNLMTNYKRGCKK